MLQNYYTSAIIHDSTTRLLLQYYYTTLYYTSPILYCTLGYATLWAGPGLHSADGGEDTQIYEMLLSNLLDLRPLASWCSRGSGKENIGSIIGVYMGKG